MVRRHRHAVPALIAAFLLGLVADRPRGGEQHAPSRCRSRQDWTNINQINIADNWSPAGLLPRRA